MSNPLVSIITPTYNQEKYIGQCIKTVLSQTFTNWEMIVVDDGSTDDTTKIVKKFDDPRIELVTQENKGIYRLSETYNKGLELASGKYIAVLEGDDCWPSKKLEKQIRFLSKSDIVLTFGNCNYIDSIGNVKREVKPMERTTILPQKFALDKLLSGNIVPAVTAMIRKSSLSSIGGFKQLDGCPFVDYPTWLKLCLEGRFCYIDEVLGFWRRHPTQMTQRHNMSLIGSQIALSFYRKLPKETKNELKINGEKIKSRIQYIMAKKMLRTGSQNKAKVGFCKSLMNGDFHLKVKSIIALITYLFHIDFEQLISFWKSQACRKSRLRHFFDKDSFKIGRKNEKSSI